jgi:hypothetical protein
VSYTTYLDNLVIVTNEVMDIVQSSFQTLLSNPVTGVPIFLAITAMITGILIRLLRGLSGGRKEV